MIISENDLVEKYNQVCEAHLKRGSLLKDLTDIELMIWIAGQSYNFGRDWQSAIDNAKHHLRDRARAERLFSLKRVDALGA